VNSVDKTFLARYLKNWDGYENLIDMKASDLNADGKVSSVDKTLLARHLKNWAGYELDKFPLGSSKS